jgi:hypothetical protein
MGMTAERTEALTQRRWSALALAGALLVGAIAGYLLGHRTALHTESVRCASALGSITCTMKDGWMVAVPLDLSWTDAAGSLHDGGRPVCLPPTGRGLEGPVEIAWTKVEADGASWRQVVWVGC